MGVGRPAVHREDVRLARLNELPDPPEHLFQSGPLPGGDRWVAIVGSRRCSQAGRQLAHRLAGALARSGAVVVSGGALGIDTAAHLGALDAGGVTVCVLPSPLDAPTPRSNRRLFRRIAAQGVLLSEATAPPTGRHSYMMRNRIVAALADELVVIEAAERSGTRHTVDAAQALGRPTYGAVWPAKDPRGDGIRPYASTGMIPVDAPADLVASACSDDPVLAALGTSALPVEALAARLGWTIPAVLSALTALELEGRVRRSSGVVAAI